MRRILQHNEVVIYSRRNCSVQLAFIRGESITSFAIVEGTAQGDSRSRRAHRSTGTLNENMQTAWLLLFYSDKEVNFYLLANGDSYPRDEKRKERKVRTIYVPVVPFKSRKRCRISVQLTFTEQ
jgi:hypothetical protein